jgi:Rieske Fe-S protein
MLPNDLSSSRRHFIRTLLLGSAGSSTFGFRWEATTLAAIAPRNLAGPEEVALLRIRTADFPPLISGSFGAVRLGFTGLGQTSPVAPIIISHDAGLYRAVSAQCTHEGCIIPPFNAAKVSTCPCHGSRFAPDGSVLRAPAPLPLPTYTVTSPTSGVLEVAIPELPPLEIAISQLLTPGAMRVGIRFLALRNLEYETLARASLDQPWEPRPFATSEQGELNLGPFRGNGVETTLYVERTNGIALLAVALRVRTV